ncbi:MAG: SDR family oxidoreductase [Actinomycetota bacterium]
MPWSIEDRTVVVTGGNSGIGHATALELARRGANVIITARNAERGRTATRHIAEESGRATSFMVLDLASFSSVRTFVHQLANEHERVDVLINNAGVYIGSRRTTPDGHEWTMGVNHLGHFILTCLLTSDAATRPERIITVASDVHTHAKRDLQFTSLSCPGHYRGIEAYARSKLANILFTRELARRLNGSSTSSFAVHPGLVATRIAQDGDSFFGSIAWKVGAHWMRRPSEGAAGPVFLATEPGIERLNGSYFADTRRIDPSDAARSDDAARRLWELSATATECGIDAMRG